MVSENKNGNKMTNHAMTAKAIRKELKANFKGIKFSVTAPYYGKVSISFDNGVKTEKVSDLVAKYKNGSFNGMEDIMSITIQMMIFHKLNIFLSAEIFLKIWKP